MTIEDQIKVEKLQYDINREAAKISALSSGKIDKYEYVTGEEMLPSNQQQIIQQAKFTYSPLGKAFEKQTKTIEDQGEKQIKAIQGNKEQSLNNYDYRKELLLTKEREMFRDIYNDKLEQMQRANFDVDYNNLKYFVASTGKQFDFSESEDHLVFLNYIKKVKYRYKKQRIYKKNMINI